MSIENLDLDINILVNYSVSIGIVLIFLFFRKLFTKIIITISLKFTSQTKTKLDDNILMILTEPIRFLFIVLGFSFAVKYLQIENKTIFDIFSGFYTFIIYWMVYNSISVFEKNIKEFAKRFGKDLGNEIGVLFVKLIKFLIIALGFVSILQVFGINVSAFLASLGLGGLAFALAAKDSASNFFGGLTILADKSLKIGDWVKIGDVEGVVEDIGIRATKIRTFEKSLITLPNQILANTPVENFNRRDIRRIKLRIGLTYDTKKDIIENIVKDIKRMLKNHSSIDKNATMLVNFDEFFDSSLSIFIYTFTNTANWGRYLDIKEDINLKIIDIVERNGAEFAFPTQSIYIQNLGEKDEKKVS